MIISDANSKEPQDGVREAVARLEQDFNAIATALLGTEEFARTASVLASIQLQLRSMLDEHMTRQLARLNMPSRDDIAALGERMTEIDERLIRIEESLRRIDPTKTSSARSRPPRTKGLDSPNSG